MFSRELASLAQPVRQSFAAEMFAGMKCQAFKRIMPKYLRGVLPKWRCLAVEIHLRRCPACGNMVLTRANNTKSGSAPRLWLRRFEARQSARNRRAGAFDAPINRMLPVFHNHMRHLGPAGYKLPLLESNGSAKTAHSFVAQKMDQLPESYRIVLHLHDIEEMSIEHVAEVLELTEEATRARLHKARSALTGLCALSLEGEP